MLDVSKKLEELHKCIKTRNLALLCAEMVKLHQTYRSFSVNLDSNISLAK